MKYAYVLNDIVHELIPQSDPVFPDVPIEKRFAPDFFAECELVDVTVLVGYIKTETGFEAPPAPEPLPGLKPEFEPEPGLQTDIGHAGISQILTHTNGTRGKHRCFIKFLNGLLNWARLTGYKIN